MMFPKPPKKEKKQPKGLTQKTPLKQYKKLEARTSLKQNTKLKSNTTLKQYTKLESKTKLKQNKKLEARTSLKQKTKLKSNSILKQYVNLKANKILKQNIKLKTNNNKISEKKSVYKVKQIRTNKRAIFSDFTKEEKAHIMKRDNEKCIFCGGTTYLGIAHIFASRQKGGVGNRKNGVVLCQICHGNLDNGKDEVLREKIQKYCENYLKNIYGDIKKEDLIYDKYKNNDKRVI